MRQSGLVKKHNHANWHAKLWMWRSHLRRFFDHKELVWRNVVNPHQSYIPAFVHIHLFCNKQVVFVSFHCWDLLWTVWNFQSNLSSSGRSGSCSSVLPSTFSLQRLFCSFHCTALRLRTPTVHQHPSVTSPPPHVPLLAWKSLARPEQNLSFLWPRSAVWAQSETGLHHCLQVSVEAFAELLGKLL